MLGFYAIGGIEHYQAPEARPKIARRFQRRVSWKE